MSVFMMILSAIGVIAVLAVAAFFVAVFRDVNKDWKAERQHAKAVFAHSGSALKGRFADNYLTPKLMLRDRSTIPYADEAAFGTDDHYLLSLAAPFNALRCPSTQTIGGFFDRVKFLDPALGPVREADKDALRVDLVDFARIENAAQLTGTLEFGLLNEMSYEVSQTLVLNRIKSVPADMLDLFEKKTTDGFQSGIETFDPTGGPLDLRSYRLVRLIHFARVGATLEWITEAEAMHHIQRIGFELRARVSRYRSWEDYGTMLARCHKYLLAEAHISKRIDAQIKALHREKWSPWNKLQIHHTEAQKQFSKSVPSLRLQMDKPHKPPLDFPELTAGRYLEAGERLLATPDCTAMGKLLDRKTLLTVPQQTLDDLVSANPDHAGIHLLAGFHALEAGFEARGTATANWVSDAAFATLEDRAGRACDLAKRGLHLAPAHHGFVDLVISAADHVRRDFRDLTQQAIELAGTTYIDDFTLQFQLMRPLLEKWGGAPNASFQMAEDRIARSDNPMAGLLFIYAAVEFVSLGAMCGGSDDRHTDMGLRARVHAVAADLLQLKDPDDARRVRSWLVYWAYSTGDREMLIRIGPFTGDFSADFIPWAYLGEGKTAVVLTLLSDIAATVGHPDWLKLTDFHEDTAKPEGQLH